MHKNFRDLMKNGPLTSLGSTLAGLAMTRGTGAALPPNANRLTPLREFGPNPGALGAWVYLPRKLRKQAPLVVVLHGCTQSAAGYDHGSGWSQLADREGFALLFPEQTRANNPNLCFNWFSPGDVTRQSGEVESIRQMIRTFVDQHDIDETQVFITGLSAGGAMTASMLACYPDVFAAGAIIAGLPHGVAQTVPHAFERMRGEGLPTRAALAQRLAAASTNTDNWPRISIWQGSADRTVAPVNAEALVTQWLGVHGVAETPDERETIDGARRRVWLRDGKPCIESWEVSGMGHGTPLSPARDGLGHAMPFMLDVGISSTTHIAQFFGLVQQKQANIADRAEPGTEAIEASVLHPVPAPAAARDIRGPVVPAHESAPAATDTVADIRPEPGKPEPEVLPPSGSPNATSVRDYVNDVLDKSLPGQHGLFGSIKDIVDRALRKAGIR